MAEDEDTTLDRAPENLKRKTTYPRNHPTENPKPPKRTKAEIQQAAKAKKEAVQAKKAAAEAEKKKKLLEAEEKRKLSAQRIASIEDAVQRSQKQLQSHSERPDIKTMETYKDRIQRQKDLQIDSEPELIASQEDHDIEIEGDASSDGIHLEFPPESAVDTDSDGIRLGLSEGEGGGDDDMDEDYSSEEDASEEESESASDDSKTYRDLSKQKERKKKVRIGLFRIVL